MKALVTGASSGIGREIALYLSELGYELILVSRDDRKLIEVQNEVKTKVQIEKMDLTDRENPWILHEKYKNEPIEILINCAGIGVFGRFDDTELEKDLELIDVNITALTILTKLFLKDMKKRNLGYIMNVSSIAGFMDGPLMAEYYASKNYVLSLTRAISTELKKENSEVVVCALCPGPTDTNFNDVAGVEFKVKPYNSEFVAEYAVNKMFEEKLVIIPGTKMKMLAIFSKFLPGEIIRNVAYSIQRRKRR